MKRVESRRTRIGNEAETAARWAMPIMLLKKSIFGTRFLTSCRTGSQCGNRPYRPVHAGSESIELRPHADLTLELSGPTRHYRAITPRLSGHYFWCRSVLICSHTAHYVRWSGNLNPFHASPAGPPATGIVSMQRGALDAEGRRTSKKCWKRLCAVLTVSRAASSGPCSGDRRSGSSA